MAAPTNKSQLQTINAAKEVAANCVVFKVTAANNGIASVDVFDG